MGASRKKFVQNNELWMPQVPKDVNGLTLGGNYQFANMKNWAHATIFWAFGNVAADGTISIKQAKDIGGGSNKALTIDSLYKLQTNAGDAKDQTRWVKEDVNAASRTLANASEDNYVFAMELEAEQLDVQNGFDCIRPEFVGGSGATLACIWVVFSNARFLGSLDDVRTRAGSVLAGEQENITP